LGHKPSKIFQAEFYQYLQLIFGCWQCFAVCKTHLFDLGGWGEHDIITYHFLCLYVNCAISSRWRLVEQDESYTSKASFLDRDSCSVKVGEKPDNWQPSGKRNKRGLYRSAQGLMLNADVNGAANIIR
jgi:hypothetical protein